MAVTKHRPGLRSGIASACLLVLATLMAHAGAAPPATSKAQRSSLPAIFQANARILFQGDSITDGGRGRGPDPNHLMGHSYAILIAARPAADHPELALQFFNRGISGHTILDLEKRWKADTLDLKPDVLSVLVGANDMTRNVPMDVYEQTYDKLLDQARQANPKLRIVLCEPFTTATGKRKENHQQWRDNMAQRQAVVQKLAAKYDAAVAHFQKALDDAGKRAPLEYWVWDGVHPTFAGHQVLADEWLRAVTEKWPAKD